MFYAAIFNNGQVSFPYTNKSNLEAHNAYRLNQLYAIIQAESKERLDDEIKSSLRSLRTGRS